MPRLSTQGFVARGAIAMPVTGGLALAIRLRIHHLAPQQIASGMAFHQQAADELKGDHLGRAAKRKLGGGLGRDGRSWWLWEWLGRWEWETPELKPKAPRRNVTVLAHAEKKSPDIVLRSKSRHICNLVKTTISFGILLLNLFAGKILAQGLFAQYPAPGPSNRALEIELKGTNCSEKDNLEWSEVAKTTVSKGKTGWSSMGPCKVIGKNQDGTNKWILLGTWADYKKDPGSPKYQPY